MSLSGASRPLCVLACALALMASLSGCDKEPAARKQKMATVKLLPDTPPPPPPPPKPEEKKPEPPKEDKPQQQPDQPKPVEAPAPQALKSDEAAGDGPGNGMAAGSVSKDYEKGEIGIGTGGDGGNRLAINAYANAVTRSLNDFLARDKDVKRHDYKVQVRVWLEPDGQLLRAELVDTTGDAQVDAALKAALGRFPGLRTAMPERMPQPMRLQVANRMIG